MAKVKRTASGSRRFREHTANVKVTLTREGKLGTKVGRFRACATAGGYWGGGKTGDSRPANDRTAFTRGQGCAYATKPRVAMARALSKLAGRLRSHRSGAFGGLKGRK